MQIHNCADVLDGGHHNECLECGASECCEHCLIDNLHSCPECEMENDCDGNHT